MSGDDSSVTIKYRASIFTTGSRKLWHVIYDHMYCLHIGKDRLLSSGHFSPLGIIIWDMFNCSLQMEEIAKYFICTCHLYWSLLIGGLLSNDLLEALQVIEIVLSHFLVLRYIMNGFIIISWLRRLDQTVCWYLSADLSACLAFSSHKKIQYNIIIHFDLNQDYKN